MAYGSILFRPKIVSALPGRARLREAGVTDFSAYRAPGTREEDLLPDLFL